MEPMEIQVDLLKCVEPTHQLRLAAREAAGASFRLTVRHLNAFHRQYGESLILAAALDPAGLLRQFASKAGLVLESLEPVDETCHTARFKPRPAYKSTPRQISIVILSYGKGPYTREAIQSIYTHTNEPFEIIVVDNKPDDQETRTLLLEMERQGLIHHLVFNDANAGVPMGWNQGLDLATGDYLLVLNNDILAAPNWLPPMLYCLESEPRAGCVTCRTNRIAGPQQIAFKEPEKIDLLGSLMPFTAAWQGLHKHGWWQTWRICGFCLLMKKSVFKEVGPFDERFGTGNFEDFDYCLRMLQKGYGLFVADESFVFHHGGVSFDEDAEQYEALLRAQEKIFVDKWQETEPELLHKVHGLLRNRYMVQYVFDPARLGEGVGNISCELVRVNFK